MTISPLDILDAAILIVDHEEANLSLLARVLHDAGHQRITSTTNLLDVCALHRKHCYDLIVLDISVPEIDCFAVTANLISTTADDHLSVLAIITQPQHLLPALKAGARDFISKPFELIEVRTRIRNLLETKLLHKKMALYAERIEALAVERQAELRAGEAHYQNLFAFATEWLWEQDEHGKTTKVSAPVLEILGFSCDVPMPDTTPLTSRRIAAQPM